MLPFTPDITRRPLTGIVLAAALLGLYVAGPASAQTGIGGSSGGSLGGGAVSPGTAAPPGITIIPVQAPTPTLTEAQQTTDILTLQATITSLTTRINSLKTTINSRAATIAALQQKLAALSVVTDTTRTDGKPNTELVVTGVNVHIVSGSQATNDNTLDTNGNPVPGKSLLGLGNLVIGYNAPGNDQGNGNVRTGSHNLSIGDQNNYTSFGGVITGHDSTISYPFASVLTGECNLAIANETVVIGGENNTAQVQQGSILGGQFNLTNSRYATVMGGQDNIAGGPDDPTIFAATTVTGGLFNYAGGQNAVVSGGQGVIQWSTFGWAAGSQGSQNYDFSNFRSP
jgi:hypothetical protein